MLLRAEFDDEAQACFVMQGFSGRAEVLEPPALRKRMLMNAKTAVALLSK